MTGSDSQKTCLHERLLAVPPDQIEERLAQLDRLATLGTLAAAMAHEIRNALVPGKTLVGLLLEKQPEDELAGMVRREIGRIDAIVTRMLKFSGSAQLNLSELRLHEVLEHSLRLIQAQLEGKYISLHRSFQAAVDRVRGDEYQLQQAFVNLLMNALEATGYNGTIAVATETLAASDGAPARLQVTIRDNGSGIAPEVMSRLFEPFFTTKPQGTGLGLPITRRIIREHHGDLSVESQPGQGATYHIFLPVLS